MAGRMPPMPSGAPSPDQLARMSRVPAAQGVTARFALAQMAKRRRSQSASRGSTRASC